MPNTYVPAAAAACLEDRRAPRRAAGLLRSSESIITVTDDDLIFALAHRSQAAFEEMNAADEALTSAHRAGDTEAPYEQSTHEHAADRWILLRDALSALKATSLVAAHIQLIIASNEVDSLYNGLDQQEGHKRAVDRMLSSVSAALTGAGGALELLGLGGMHSLHCDPWKTTEQRKQAAQCDPATGSMHVA
jgi:hypothetical protein